MSATGDGTGSGKYVLGDAGSGTKDVAIGGATVETTKTFSSRGDVGEQSPILPGKGQQQEPG